MLILNNPISRASLREYAANTFGDMIKCVADVDKGLLAIDADLHGIDFPAADGQHRQRNFPYL